MAKLVPGRVSTEVDARLAYDSHGIIRKVLFPSQNPYWTLLDHNIHSVEEALEPKVF